MEHHIEEYYKRYYHGVGMSLFTVIQTTWREN